MLVRKASIGVKFLIAGALCFASVFASAQLKVSTVAGGFEGDGGRATSAGLMGPGAVAVDKKDRLYIGELDNCQIRRVNTDGIIRRFAGHRICGFSGDGGPAKTATFTTTTALAFDHDGNLLVGDSGNARIRRIDCKGKVTTVAGTGTFGDSGDGGPATQANIGDVAGIAIDSLNRIYFSDSNSVVRMVDAAGIIHTVAGNGTEGFSGDNGPATSAQLAGPQGLAVDGDGNLYIADASNSRIRKVDPNGIITTFAGSGAADNSGNGGLATSAGLAYPLGLVLKDNTLYISTASNVIWAVDLSTQVINMVAGSMPSPVGGFNGDGNHALATRLNLPNGMAFDSAGNLYVADEGNDRVRKINPAQIVSTVAGGHLGDDGPARKASLNSGFNVHLAFDAAGNLYVADPGNNRVRKITPEGIISTFAGNGFSGYSGDGGLATNAMLNDPNSVTVDNQGNVFIADSGNGVIRKVDASGVISTFAKPSPYGYGTTVIGLATDKSGNLYSTDGLSLVYKTDPSGKSTVFAGSGFNATDGDGIPATQAQLNFPTGLAVDQNGNVYIDEWLGERVRKVDTNGIITTVAGTGVQGFSGDGGPATNARLSLPLDVAVDQQGNLYIADLENDRIRMVDTSGIIHTIAGTGVFGFNGNHLPATDTNITPTGITVKPNGTVFFTDEDRYLVRKLR